MRPLLVIGSPSGGQDIRRMWQPVLPADVQWVEHYNPNVEYRDRKILFLVEVDAMGGCSEIHRHMLRLWAQEGDQALMGSEAILFVSAIGELYTKRAAQTLIFNANRMGCRFPGHSTVESLRGLSNFKTWQKTLPLSLDEIQEDQCRKALDRLLAYTSHRPAGAKILALHASSHETSNTLMLWEAVKSHLPSEAVETLHIENGSVVDCKGCDFKTCIHFAKQNTCFYGGTVIRDIFPAIERADAVVWISPNYNDALSAMHTALINRLTALYRRMPLYEKRFYGIVVSGNSGCDSLACQLIGALNINKGMDLPPHFALMKIANDPGSILQVPNIDKHAMDFAARIRLELGL